ncbi:MAG: 23S rRNA (adenine(2503)-C(2))-methyltransferase RlmN [Desulfobacteraceae bacterium]|nr:MAG: 23S rRNA (adenine(2503)-C(2))-methyltransferase RlmN [Desulfobacteraceae bacterium]
MPAPVAVVKLFENTLPQLEHTLSTRFGKGAFHANALYREVFRNGNLVPFNIPEFTNSPKLTKALEPLVQIDTGRVVHTLSEAHLIKFVTRLSDGVEIESVIIPMTDYYTLCVSCQAGCRMGCRFCETGNMGFARSLSCEEIVGQVFNARHVLKVPVKNVVFMGMGEPFDNFDAVIQAIRVMHEQRGFDIALRHITISTAGLTRGIERFARLDLPQVKLAVSIHAACNEKRSKIMPINRHMPLEAIKKALLTVPLTARGTFLFEYVLIRDFNDSRQDAEMLARYIHPLKVRLNLMTHNPIQGFEGRPVSEAHMHRFGDWLRDEGVFVIKRWGKGTGVSAGCGQLARNMKQKKMSCG